MRTKPARLTNSARLRLQSVRLFNRERSAVKQNAAASIRDGPIVAVAHPAFNLTSPDLFRIVRQRSDDARFVHSSRPQLQGERVIAPMRPRNLAQDRRADAQQLASGCDSETALPLGVARAGECAQVLEDPRSRLHSRNYS